MTLQTLPTEQAEAATSVVHHREVLPVENEATLVEVLTQLAYRKWLIAKATGGAMLIGLVLCFALPVRYTATAKIMPPQQTQSTASMLMTQLAGSGAGSLAAIAGGGLGLKNPDDLYVGLLTSRPVADAIIEKYGLANVYHSRNMTQARKKLADYTEVNAEKNGFIAISVTDTDKKRAAEMANAYTDQLRILTKTLAVTEASHRRLFYDEQLKQSKEALVAAALAFEQIQQQKGLVQLDAQAKAMIEGLAALRAQVSAKQVEVQALRSYSTEQNPQVQLAEKELSALEAEEFHIEESGHTPGIAGLGLGSVPSAGLEYLRAEHELQYQQAIYDMLMRQSDAARLDESKDATIIQVVESATEPDEKSSPKRAMLVALFIFGGFIVGVLLALLSWWRECMRSDPFAANRLEKLRIAFKGRMIASS
jgi:uncharacterized protein involved in exopolysaccharide biosynthesis